VQKRGGTLFYYYPSLEAALRAIYPNYQWQTVAFLEAGSKIWGFWKNENKLLEALDWAEKKIGIQKVKIAFFPKNVRLISPKFSLKIGTPLH